MKYRFLSHPICDGMPVYGGKAELGKRQVRSIPGGDTANVHTFSMQNHWGTHVDAPRHFFEKGKSVGDYPARTWFFSSPLFVDVVLGGSCILKIGDWTENIEPSNDIILFRSGWTAHREEERYIYDNPGIAPEVGLFLRHRFPGIRAIGIDWISLSSFNNRELGALAHKAFLDPEGENEPVLIVEDMALGENMQGLVSAVVSPLIVSGTDSAPCTVIGVFDD